MTTQEEYKIKQTQSIENLQAGTKDINGHDVLRVLVKSDEFVIYEIVAASPPDSLKTYIHTLDEEDSKGTTDHFNNIRGCLADFKSVLHKVQDRNIFTTRAAHIIAHALNGKSTEAIQQFEKMINEINARYQDQFKHRLRYLLTTMVIVLCLICTCILTYSQIITIQFPYLTKLLYIGTAGSIGGFISISRRLKETVFEDGVSGTLFVMYAFERIFISIFAAVIVFFAIECNFIFGLVNKLQKPLHGYIIFSVVAGFSETLLPNLLIKFENKS